MNTLPERLKYERERLGFNQTAFAELIGANRTTLFNWERGLSSPTADALTKWAKKGLDILFIVTGERTTPVEPFVSKQEADQAVADAVFTAANALVSAGNENPTIFEVRARVPAASAESVRKHLYAWRDQNLKRSPLQKIRSILAKPLKKVDALVSDSNNALAHLIKSVPTPAVEIAELQTVIERLQSALTQSEQARIAAEETLAAIAELSTAPR